MNAKKTILVLCDWFLPGFLAGGPIQSIATLTQNLKNDVNFKIITTDRDLNSDKSYDNLPINKWTVYENRDVFYVGHENLNRKFILDLINKTPHDAIYLNSLFSKLFTIYPLIWKKQKKINTAIILAPRGMLRDGALAVKPLKKQIFLLYAKLNGLFNNIIWQSTSLDETKEIKKRISNDVKVFEISNFPAVSSQLKKIEKKVGFLKLCFIARIVDIKNLNFAIDILKQIKTEYIVFDIYGPKEDKEYWRLCEQNALFLPNNIQLTYKSILKQSDIGKKINEYHALFLPTQTENFGHIIAETFQNCRPVIISDQTPWRYLENNKVGFDLPLNDKNKFIESIVKLSQLNQNEFDLICKSCAIYINEKLNIEMIKKQYLAMFKS